MDCALLYSGGKDSTLAALVIDRFYDVTLVGGSFGVVESVEYAREAAEAVGFQFEVVDLDKAIAVEALEQMIDDGYPRHGIQRVHEHALETVANLEYDAVADGTRRDDRVPTVSRAFAQSLEDRHGIDYLSPLSGFGRTAIDRMVAEHLHVEEGPSAEIQKGDYETELRALIADEYGSDRVEEVFPHHTQTRVLGRR